MGVVEWCTKNVWTLPGDATADEAARMMRDRSIGSVVVETDDGPGIVTDRDLAVQLLAERRDPRRTRVADVANAPAATVSADTPLSEAAKLMRQCGVRRLPVTGAGGAIVGIVSYDDLLELLGRELGDLAAVIRDEAGG